MTKAIEDFKFSINRFAVSQCYLCNIMIMASTDARIDMPPLREQIFVPRKRFKTTELPLNSTQRSTIDSLLHTIKKKGEYDALRKKVWSQYAESVSVKPECLLHYWLQDIAQGRSADGIA